jgi:hypothetical protein
MRSASGLTPLGRGAWAAVYRLLKARNFPHVPATFKEAKVALTRVELLAVYAADGSLQVVFAVGQPDDGIAFLDVVCAPGAAGNWATKPLLRDLKSHFFEARALRAVWVQVHSKVALKAALQAGMTPVTPLTVPQPILVMTRQMAAVPARLVKLQQGKDEPHGQFI